MAKAFVLKTCSDPTDRINLLFPQIAIFQAETKEDVINFLGGSKVSTDGSSFTIPRTKLKELAEKGLIDVWLFEQWLDREVGQIFTLHELPLISVTI